MQSSQLFRCLSAKRDTRDKWTHCQHKQHQRAAKFCAPYKYHQSILTHARDCPITRYMDETQRTTATTTASYMWSHAQGKVYIYIAATATAAAEKKKTKLNQENETKQNKAHRHFYTNVFNGTSRDNDDSEYLEGFSCLFKRFKFGFVL